jgi:hypothetical protein
MSHGVDYEWKEIFGSDDSDDESSGPHELIIYVDGSDSDDEYDSDDDDSDDDSDDFADGA